MDIEKCEYCGNDVFRAIKVTKWVYEKQNSIYGAWQCQKCLSEIYISTSASEGSVGFVSISEED